MRLISYMDAANRQGGTVATDMDVIEFYNFWRTYIVGHDYAITHVMDISEADFRRWKLDGYTSITKQDARVQRAMR